MKRNGKLYIRFDGGFNSSRTKLEYVAYCGDICGSAYNVKDLAKKIAKSYKEKEQSKKESDISFYNHKEREKVHIGHNECCRWATQLTRPFTTEELEEFVVELTKEMYEIS